jgi:restriction system protein
LLDVVHKLGYCTVALISNEGGRLGYAGVDRAISLDRLGLGKVYIQAKRWNSVVRGWRSSS